MSRRPQRRSYVLAWSAGLAVLLVLGALLLRAQQRRLVQEEVDKLAAIATLKVDQIVAWRAERLADAGMLMGSPYFARASVRWLEQPEPEDAGLILERMRNTMRLYGYSDLSLVDERGTSRLAVRGGQDGPHPELDEALRRAWSSGEPTLTDLHLSEGGTPHLAAVAPLFRWPGRQPAGAVVLRVDASSFLYPLIQSWPVPSRTAETLLARREGDEVLFLNELRHRSDTALRLRLPLTRTDVPAVRAALGVTGPMEGVDYRGVPVLAVLKAIPSSPWVMVAKVDREEALAALRREQGLLVGLLAALALAGTAVLTAVWQLGAKAFYRQQLQLERQLDAAEIRHLVTLMSIGDAVIATDREGRVELLNPVAEQLTGWRQEDARGRPLGEVFVIVNEDTRAPVEDPVARVLRSGKVVGLANHTLLLARDGREIPIADSGAPIRDLEGAIVGVVLVFRDQTRERAAQKAIRDSEEFVRFILDNLPVGVAVNAVDPQVAFDYFNPAFCQHYRVTPEQLATPDGFWAAAYPDPGQREEIRRRVLEDCASGDPQRMHWEEVRIARRGEEPTYISARNVPLAGGRMLSLVWDVTDRKRLQEQLLHAQKLEAIGTLAGGIAHDFNNLLQALLGTVQTARLRVEQGPCADTFAELEALVRRGADLARQLLLFAGKQPGQRAVVNLAALVREQVGLFRRLLPENIRVDVELPANGLPVEGDPTQLGQVLANLAVNARDAMPEGGTLAIRAAATDGQVLLEVRDTGVGMNEEVRRRIFEPFYSTKPLGRGTGLGLAVVWGIVAEHGGTIEVESAPGAGSMFRIVFPAAAAPSGPGEPSSGSQLPVGAGERVLVVEDEEAARGALVEMLGELGYTVTAVASAEEARRLPDEPGFDVVVTDYLLPGVNGLELATALQRRWPDLKVIVMSGYAPEDVAGSLLASGHGHFLQKPFDMKDLARAVRASLGDPTAPQGRQAPS
ncbi:MAG: PAS domain-containing protein [Acidobacteriota bacterium]